MVGTERVETPMSLIFSQNVIPNVLFMSLLTSV